MSAVASWLLEQITEDERLTAEYAAAGVPPPWDLPPTIHDFLSAFDPVRVLVECDAKRRMIALHVFECAGHDGPWIPCGPDVCDMRCNADGQDPPCETQRLLALPYADRLGYDEAWRP